GRGWWIPRKRGTRGSAAMVARKSRRVAGSMVPRYGGERLREVSSGMRRRTLVRSAAAALALNAIGWRPLGASPAPLFRISLAQWSLHRALSGTLGPGEDRVALLRSDPDRALRGT